MSIFRMKPKHLTNVPQFDEEHHQLFEILNMLRRDLVIPDNLHAARDTFFILENHTRIHFAHEELVMRECDYPGFHIHRQIHRNLLGQLGGMGAQLDGGKSFAAKSFNTSLAIWLGGHILAEDVKLGRHICSLEENEQFSAPGMRWWGARSPGLQIAHHCSA